MHPTESKFLEEVYFDATKDAHGYILLDLKQSTPNELRIQRNVFYKSDRYVYIF
jgi:hypothetical protein